MYRHPRDPDHFEILGTFDAYVQRHGLGFTNDAADSLITQLQKKLEEHRNHRTRLFGFRTESMFAHVAAGLGKCVLINQEDSGTFFDGDGTMRRPDFRVVTNSGNQFLVEVKNHFQKNATSPFSLSKKYWSSLVSYSDAVKTPLMLAIYWSRWNMWTLTSSSRLKCVNGKFQMGLGEAMMENEFDLLGDSLLHTIPPLSIRFAVDKSLAQSTDQSRHHVQVSFAGLFAAGERIASPIEQELAWHFMIYGKWNHVEQVAVSEDGAVQYLELRVEPEASEVDESHSFQSLGFLSGMISCQFIRGTSINQEVVRFTPNSSRLGVEIPDNFRGDVLKLWKFVLHPKYRTVSAPL